MNAQQLRNPEARFRSHTRCALAFLLGAAMSLGATATVAEPIGPGEVITVVPEPGKGGPKLTLAVPSAEGTIEIRDLNAVSETLAIKTIQFDPSLSGTYSTQIAYLGEDGMMHNVGGLFPVQFGGDLGGGADTEWDWECTELRSGKWIWSSSDGSVITWDPIIHEMEVQGINGYYAADVPPPAVGALAAISITNNTPGILDATAAFSAGDPGPVESLQISPSDDPHATAFDVALRWQLELDQELLQQETADGVIQLTVDTSTVASLIIPIVITAGSGACSGSPCDAGCGTATIDGVSHPLTCDADTCTCKTPILETPLATGLALLPGQVLGLDVQFSPSTFPQRAFSGTLEWGAWQRRVVDTRVVPVSGGMYEISLDWVVELQGPLGIPIDLGALARGTYIDSNQCSQANYFDCTDCCLGACECSAGDGTEDDIIWDIGDSGIPTSCSTPLDCPIESINGVPTSMDCNDQTSRCRTPVFTSTLRAPLQPGQPFIAYLKPIAGAVPELDYSMVGVNVGPQAAIPAVTTWGLVALLLGVAAAGTIAIRQRLGTIAG